MTDILRIALPLTLWLAIFSLIYGLQGVVCSDRWDIGGERLVLGLAWGMGVLMQAGLLLALRSPRFASPSRGLQRSVLALAVAALVATVWSLFPVLVLPVCQ